MEAQNDENEGETEQIKRAGWGNKIEFLLSVLSFAVGLGNIWRFSFYLERGGGGIFSLNNAIPHAYHSKPVDV